MADQCPVCAGPAEYQGNVQGSDVQIWKCPSCGTYRVTPEAIALVNRWPPIEIGRLAGALYDRARNPPPHTLKGSFVVTTENAPTLAATVSNRIPDRLDRLLTRLGERLPYAGTGTRIARHEGRSMAAAANEHEYTLMLRELHARGYLGDINDIHLTLKGWERYEELASARPAGHQAFVAMSFSDDLDAAYFDGIKPAVEETGHTSMRLKDLQHAGKIDDRIILEIRRSRFVVADFTLQRQSVYYEAGYAQALGKTVIWTCRNTELKDLHFDTRQYAHISWNDPDELRARLSERIRVLFT